MLLAVCFVTCSDGSATDVVVFAGSFLRERCTFVFAGNCISSSCNLLPRWTRPGPVAAVHAVTFVRLSPVSLYKGVVYGGIDAIILVDARDSEHLRAKLRLSTGTDLAAIG